MMRWHTIFWVTLTICAGIGLFVVKYEVRDLESRLAGLNRELVAERESIHVLRAEWAFLSRPERIESLATRFLKLQPLRADQTITINELMARLDAAALARHAPSVSLSEWSRPNVPMGRTARLRKSP